jgi:hypothetical protein
LFFPAANPVVDRQGGIPITIFQKVYWVSGEDTIHGDQCQLMLFRLRDQQTIKRITVNRWKLSQVNHRPHVNWQRRDSMGCSLLRKIGCR